MVEGQTRSYGVFRQMYMLGPRIDGRLWGRVVSSKARELKVLEVSHGRRLVFLDSTLRQTKFTNGPASLDMGIPFVKWKCKAVVKVR